MNTTLLCLVALITTDLPENQHQSIYQTSPVFEAAIRGERIIRGQSPVYGQDPSGATFGSGPAPAFINPIAGNGYQPPLAGGQPAYGGGPAFLPPQQGLMSPYSPVAPGQNPFLGGGSQMGATPYGSPYGFSRLNGAQPLRYGWTDRVSLGFLPKQDVTGATATGDLSVLELDYLKEYITQGPGGWAWTFSPEFNYRSFGGPGTPNLSPNFYRFAAGIKANSPSNGPWRWQLGFTPSLGTDFKQHLDSKAWMFDADLVLFSELIPETLQLVLGVSYWDRVDDIILPQAGFVWTPSEYVEWRLVFPKPRVDFMVGNPNGYPLWMYLRAEYSVEAFQADLDPPGTNDQIQIEDWRVFLGLRGDNGYVSNFAEVGAVFGRDFTFDTTAASNFEVGSSIMFRMGFRY